VDEKLKGIVSQWFTKGDNDLKTAEYEQRGKIGKSWITDKHSGMTSRNCEGAKNSGGMLSGFCSITESSHTKQHHTTTTKRGLTLAMICGIDERIDTGAHIHPPSDL